ncbi:MAG: fibro-slime domain-containing protein [Polyangiaceae bacterium]
MSRPFLRALVAPAALTLLAGFVACETTVGPDATFDAGGDGRDSSVDTGSTVPDGGFPLPDGGTRPDGGDGGCGPSLLGVLRDFKGKDEPGGHPDFEGTTGDDRGMVEDTIGPDGKPVYAGTPTTPTTNGRAAFDQWFRDTPEVNKKKLFLLPAQVDPQTGRTVFDSNAFFPLDNDPEGFGNTPNFPHDYHFTYELHTEFSYGGGEVFKFRGDDDVWVFIGGKRVVDLGGVHVAQEATVDLDAEAARLGIVKGQTYALDFFFAERHTVESNFRLETTLKFTNCAPIIK